MKAVIWDLDCTLWNGTIYHGDKVSLKPETKEVLKQLDKLGIIQCVCTHNDIVPALMQIQQFGLEKYFKIVAGRTDTDKAVMIQKILDELELEPEEVLFVDDIQLNREHVKLAVGCHIDYETDLFKIMKYFDTDRLLSMNQHRDRLNAEKRWKGTMRDFLKTIDMDIHIKTAEIFELERITNLANRTNELNATRTRYTEDAIRAFFINDKYEIYVVYLKDKFGDYGLIG